MSAKPWIIAYDRHTRSWGVITSGRVSYVVTAPGDMRGKRDELPPGFYTGGGPSKESAQKLADEYNARTVDGLPAYTLLDD